VTESFTIEIGSDFHQIPYAPEARTALARQLCFLHGGSPIALGRLLSKPVDSMQYMSMEIRGPKQSCDDHRHLFDAEGNLHCVLPNAVQFGIRAGLVHGKNLTPVLTGNQAQCRGWRSKLDLLVSPKGQIVQAFILGEETRSNHQHSRAAFCDKHNLHEGAICDLIIGEREEHKGWRLCATIDADSLAREGHRYLDSHDSVVPLKRNSWLQSELQRSERLPPPQIRLSPTAQFFFHKISRAGNLTCVASQGVMNPHDVYTALGITGKLMNTEFHTPIDKLDPKRLRTLIQSADEPIMAVLRAYVGTDDVDNLLQLLADRHRELDSSAERSLCMRTLKDQPIVLDVVKAYNDSKDTAGKVQALSVLCHQFKSLQLQQLPFVVQPDKHMFGAARSHANAFGAAQTAPFERITRI
jgi:hypothetical protein